MNKIMQWIKSHVNNKGSVLLETMAGMAVLTMLVVAFSATVAQANFLFLRATYDSREWEKIFKGLEAQDNTGITETGTGTVFAMDMKMEKITGADIYLFDPSQPNGEKQYQSLAPSVVYTPARTTSLVTGLKFKQKEKGIESPTGIKKVHVYQIDK
ncbi:MAG: hypothetical protein RR869_08905 [Lachnospiraceae bacterium]